APGLPTAGGAVGALRSLELELPGVRCKAIDFDHARLPADIASVLVRELSAEPDDVEIGYRGGERTVFVPAPAPQTPPDPSIATLPNGGIALATGGAGGITAELLRSMAKPGMTVILVGRSPLEVNGSAVPEEPSDPAALRAQLIERSRANGAHRRPA